MNQPTLWMAMVTIAELPALESDGLEAADRLSNAALIVAAVNSHAALVDALRELLYNTERNDFNARSLDKAREALRKAEAQ